ncbi:type II secretion system protein N [Maricaulaceae bacterium MS644]
MTRWILYALLGLAAFIGFAVAGAPARLVYDVAARPAGIEAGMVTGTVWNASARRVRAGGLALSHVEARLRPAPLLTGRAVFDVSVADPALRGAGRVTLSGGGARFEDAAGVVALDAISALAAADLPAGESARVEIERLVLDGAGACLEAEGRVTSAALVSVGERYGAQLPMLTGDLTCDGETVALLVSGRSDALVLSGRVRLPTAGPRWRIEARTAERDIIAALSLMGFDQQGEGFIAEGGSQETAP